MVANPDEPTYIPNTFSNFMGNMNFWQRFENTFGIWKDKFVFSYYSAYQDDKIKKYIGPHTPNLREVEKNVSLLLVNTHFTIHGPRPLITTVVEIGGMHIPEKIDALPEVSRPDSLISTMIKLLQRKVNVLLFFKGFTNMAGRKHSWFRIRFFRYDDEN